MERILIPWGTGKGNIVIEEVGGELKLSSDTVNDSVDRTQTVRYYTTNTSGATAEATQQVTQLGLRIGLRDSNALTLRDKNGLILTALK